MTDLPQVWSCGGGTQSVAIAALIVQGKLPKPDWACIVDTGREKATTWEYMDAVLLPELADVGVTLHRIPSKDFASIDPFENESLLLPAFTTLHGDKGKLANFCSGRWKTRVLDRFLRKQGVGKYVKWIGFSLDEYKRINRMTKGEEWKEGRVRFPLVQDVPMRRHGCIMLVEEMGWPTPPRSACWMCPNQSDEEWRSLTPEEFAQAVALDYSIREVDPHAFLHSSCVPLDQVDFTQEDGPNLFGERPCSSGMCFV